MATVLQADYMCDFVSDEAHGVMGGVKTMYENWRDNNLTGDNYIDTFKQGYQEYRDASRQELNDGYVRNPVVSGLAEVAGAVMSPIKIHSPRGYTGSLGSIVSPITNCELSGIWRCQ